MRCELNMVIHATESMNKILDSVKKVLNIKIDQVKIERRDLSGHYGNPIIYLIIKLNKDDTINLLNSIKNKLSSDELSRLLNNIEDFFDRNKIYLRFSKANLCRGRLVLEEAESIKIVIKNISINKFIRFMSSKSSPNKF